MLLGRIIIKMIGTLQSIGCFLNNKPYYTLVLVHYTSLPLLQRVNILLELWRLSAWLSRWLRVKDLTPSCTWYIRLSTLHTLADSIIKACFPVSESPWWRAAPSPYAPAVLVLWQWTALVGRLTWSSSLCRDFPRGRGDWSHLWWLWVSQASPGKRTEIC